MYTNFGLLKGNTLERYITRGRFSVDMDFDAIVKALKEIDYKGYFTLEADQFLKDYNEENVFEGVVKLQRSAKKLAEMFLKENF